MPTVSDNTPVPIWRLFLRMGGWFTVVFLAIFLLMALISFVPIHLEKKFQEGKRETVALIKDKQINTYVDSDGNHITEFYVVLSYTTQDGQPIEVADHVWGTDYNAAIVGTEVPLWYLEDDPTVFMRDENENEETHFVMSILTAISGALTLGAFWYSGQRAVAAVRARRYGLLETARVTGVRHTNVTVNNRPMMRLEWKEDSGRLGRSLMYYRDDLQPYAKTGTRIQVYQGIKRAWWTGDVGKRPDGGAPTT